MIIRLRIFGRESVAREISLSPGVSLIEGRTPDVITITGGDCVHDSQRVTVQFGYWRFLVWLLARLPHACWHVVKRLVHGA